MVKAQLAQNSAVRWCMVIKPYGFSIWENMQKILDFLFKKTGHQNAYFPLFIPKSFFTKEAKHVEWFATEAAIVTHYRLKNQDWEMIADPEAKLEEELIVRPTSETIIWNTYKDWITSYRDLPLLINQRANVVRREMRTRLFLRSAEFLWQEGHTAHATKQEAIDETQKMWKVYQLFFEKILAISWVPGEKSEQERFAGAENTYTIECMMQDGKALQACTSHFLWQNFGKAFDVSFTTKDNTQDFAWATSRWASTRMMWGLIMSHGDDQWLILPPMIAPIHVVIIPIWKTEEEKKQVSTFIDQLIADRDSKIIQIDFMIDGKNHVYQRSLEYLIDWDDQKSMWWKQNQYELQWVPIRIAIWPRDVSAWTIHIALRDQKEKLTMGINQFNDQLIQLLYQMQNRLFENTQSMREQHTVKVNTRSDFQQALDQWKFVLAHRDGTSETEKKIKEETKATIRCIPYDEAGNDLYPESWSCILTWAPSDRRVLFAIAY